MLMAENGVVGHALALAQREWGGQVDNGRLLPLGPLLRSLASVSFCSVVGNWYPVEADSRKERTAVESVADLGFPAYRPIVSKIEVSRGRKVDTERSMFGKYFFVKCEPTVDNWHRVRTARGVRRLVQTTGAGHWISVPEGAMEAVRLAESQNSTAIGSSRFIWHFSPGDEVRVKTGPFAWFYAQVTSAVDERGRIKALVDIFGRKTPVEFEADQLEAT